MRKLILLTAFLTGCGGAAAPTVRTVTASGCTWSIESDDTLGCMPSTSDGCICGAADANDMPAGSCHVGSCCTGCWDVGDPTRGIPARCWPGDGSGDAAGGPRYGSHGASCRAEPLPAPVAASQP